MQKDVTSVGTTSRQYWTVWLSDPLVAVRSISYLPVVVRLPALTFRSATDVEVSAGRFSWTLEGLILTCGLFGSEGVTVPVKLIVPLNPV